MKQKAAIRNGLDGLKQQFESWRGKNSKGARLPDELWAAAVKAAQEHGVNPVSDHLRVNYYSLKRRLDRSPKLVRRRKYRKTKFVEVSGTGLLRRPQCAVELQDGSGKRLRVELDGIKFSDVELLARKLWRGKR